MNDVNCSCEFSRKYCPVHKTDNADAEKLLAILPVLSKLNSWARLPGEQQLGMSTAVPWIYKWKRTVIKAAIKLGMAELRIVSCERSCKTCGGTGEYKWQNWDDEYDVRFEDCRRCSATGKVILRFVESRIGGFSWHTPRPKWDLGIFADDAWEKIAVATDWTPEQPGAPLERFEFIGLINDVERIIYDGRRIERGWGSYGESFGLDLGELPECWICGASKVRYAWDIYRQIGLRWKAGLCEACEQSSRWSDYVQSWPVNLHRPRNERDCRPVWHDRCPLPDAAFHPAVVEWLARREIFFGRYYPQELAWTCCGDMVRVLSATPTEYRVQVLDRYGHNGTWDGRPCREYIGPFNDAEITVRELGPTARNPYLPEFDWSEVAA